MTTERYFTDNVTVERMVERMPLSVRLNYHKFTEYLRMYFEWILENQFDDVFELSDLYNNFVADEKNKQLLEWFDYYIGDLFNVTDNPIAPGDIDLNVANVDKLRYYIAITPFVMPFKSSEYGMQSLHGCTHTRIEPHVQMGSNSKFIAHRTKCIYFKDYPLEFMENWYGFNMLLNCNDDDSGERLTIPVVGQDFIGDDVIRLGFQPSQLGDVKPNWSDITLLNYDGSYICKIDPENLMNVYQAFKPLDNQVSQYKFNSVENLDIRKQLLTSDYGSSVKLIPQDFLDTTALSNVYYGAYYTMRPLPFLEYIDNYYPYSTLRGVLKKTINGRVTTIGIIDDTENTITRFEYNGYIESITDKESNEQYKYRERGYEPFQLALIANDGISQSNQGILNIFKNGTDLIGTLWLDWWPRFTEFMVCNNRPATVGLSNGKWLTESYDIVPYAYQTNLTEKVAKYVDPVYTKLNETDIFN